MPAVIVALAIVFGSINPNFWSATNLANVSRQMSILALLALGQWAWRRSRDRITIQGG